MYIYIYYNEIKKKENADIYYMELTLPRVLGLVMLGVHAVSHASNVENISVREGSKTQEISGHGLTIISSAGTTTGTVIGGACFRDSTIKRVLKRSPFKRGGERVDDMVKEWWRNTNSNIRNSFIPERYQAMGSGGVGSGGHLVVTWGQIQRVSRHVSLLVGPNQGASFAHGSSHLGCFLQQRCGWHVRRGRRCWVGRESGTTSPTTTSRVRVFMESTHMILVREEWGGGGGEINGGRWLLSKPRGHETLLLFLQWQQIHVTMDVLMMRGWRDHYS